MKRLKRNREFRMKNSIENIIVKFLNTEANAFELEFLENWIKEPENEKLFLEYVKINYLIDINTKQFDHSNILQEINSLLKKEDKRFSRLNKKLVFRYAAVFLILVSIFWVYTFTNADKNENQSSINEVILKSENGLINVLNQKGETQITNREGAILFNKIDDTLVYNENQDLDVLVYNTIIVPYGKKFSVKLSDGTKIQLNSGTSFRFPVKFLKNQDRRVFIEYGEAFFEVAKDKNQPFIVNNDNIDIKVLGTQFNVSAYPEDKSTTTMLVEGSVQLFENSKINNKNSVLLKPGFKAIWVDEKENFALSKADVEIHTAWRTGKIVLKSLPFKQMINKLERHYDVKIECRENQLNDEIITATFDKESITDVLKLINEIHPIDYKINGRNVTIIKNEK